MSKAINSIAVMLFLMLLSFNANASSAGDDFMRFVYGIISPSDGTGLMGVILTLVPVAGIAMIVVSLVKFAKAGEMQSKESKIALMLMFFVGIAFLNFSAIIRVYVSSMFGTTPFSGSGDVALSYSSSDMGDDGIKNASKFVLTVVQLSGVIGIIKSLTLLNKPGEQGGGPIPALKVGVGASLAINMEAFLKMVAEGLGDTGAVITKWLP